MSSLKVEADASGRITHCDKGEVPPGVHVSIARNIQPHIAAILARALEAHREAAAGQLDLPRNSHLKVA